MKYGTGIVRAALFAALIVPLSTIALAQSSSGTGAGSPNESSGIPSGASGGPSDLMPRDVCEPADMNPSCLPPTGIDAPADRPAGTSGSSGAVDVEQRPMPNPQTPVEDPDR